MLLDNYDPSSVKLYSKCGRNQASKYKHKKRPQSQGRPYSSIVISCENKKVKKTLCTFDMIESRQQRQIKSKATITPAVGQYNLKQENKIKLTWDILKIFKNKTQSRKTSKISQGHNKQQINKDKSIIQNQLTSQLSQNIVNQNHQVENQTYSDRKQQKQEKARYFYKKSINQNSRYKTIKSQVDMSRMTGRPQSKHTFTQNDSQQPSTELNVSKSIQYLKSKPSLNLQFDRQISRQKINSLNKPLIVPSDYSYNYSIIKPKVSAYISFQKTAGRNSLKKLQNSYSYTHYDYDKYVWDSKSNVYSNTKTHIIDFKKQKNRKLFKR